MTTTTIERACKIIGRGRADYRLGTPRTVLARQVSSIESAYNAQNREYRRLPSTESGAVGDLVTDDARNVYEIVAVNGHGELVVELWGRVQ